MPLAHREGTFPRFDVILYSLPRGVRRPVHVAVLLVEFVIYAVVMWYVLRFSWQSIEGSRTMQIGTDFLPLWPILVMMPLAFGLMLLEMGRLLHRDLLRLLGRESSGDESAHTGPSAV